MAHDVSDQNPIGIRTRCGLACLIKVPQGRIVHFPATFFEQAKRLIWQLGGCNSRNSGRLLLVRMNAVYRCAQLKGKTSNAYRISCRWIVLVFIGFPSIPFVSGCCRFFYLVWMGILALSELGGMLHVCPLRHPSALVANVAN